MTPPVKSDTEEMPTAPELINQARRWENIAFAGGVVIFLFHGLMETLLTACVRIGYCYETKFEIPWVQFVIALILIIPHTLGRAQAKIIIEAIADRIRGKKE